MKCLRMKVTAGIASHSRHNLRHNQMFAISLSHIYTDTGNRLHIKALRLHCTEHSQTTA